jgi:ActR/RegA family two-component response regulator
VDWLLGELRAGDRVREASLDLLREEARRAAAAGRPVASVLDPYLSAGWAIWEAAAAIPGAAAALPALGGILLRAGDASAAQIASAYAGAEAALAARTASARREFLDELLVARPGDPSLVRLMRRAPSYGLASGTPVRVVLAAGERDLNDDDPALGRLAAELGPRAAIVATDRGRALAIVRSGAARESSIRAALDASLGAGGWTAVAAAVDQGLPGLGAAVASAHAALGIACRLGRRGALNPPDATLLEQALLADEMLLARGVAAALAPLTTTPRTGAELVATLRVFLETAGNRRETARRLGLAPRTIAYRLRRIEERLGVRLVGIDLLRLGAALFAFELLGADATEMPGPAPGASPAVKPSSGPVRR